MDALYRRPLVVVTLFLLLAPATRAQEAPARYRARLEAKDIDFRTDWYGVYLQDRKVGFMRGSRTKLDGGLIQESETVSLKLVSFGQKAELTIENTLVFQGTAPFDLLRGTFTESDGKLSKKVAIRKLDQGYEFTHEAGDLRQVKRDAKLAFSLADSMTQDLWIRSGPAVGDKIHFDHLDLGEQKLDLQTSVILSRKNSLVNGVDVRLFEIETESRDKGIKALSRHDATGLMLSDQVAVFELRLESEEQAKNTQFSQDLFVMGMVKIDRKIGDSRRVRELVVRVEGKEAGALEDGPRQSISAGDTKGSRILKLGKMHGKAVKATAKEIEDNLAETAACPITDPAVRTLAEKAVGDAKTPQEKVERLVKFVHDYIKPNLSANMPQIHDLIKNKKGDCKSYALLFVNLARAAGVPAREVSGLLYIGDDQKAFGGHAWNEVVLNGVWVPIDASIGETEVNATHVSFGSENRATANLLNTIGKLSFRLIEVQN